MISLLLLAALAATPVPNPGCGDPALTFEVDAAANQSAEDLAYVKSAKEALPTWYADVKFARYEVEELATVSTDVLMAEASRMDPDALSRWTKKLRADWDILVVLDDSLHRNYWM
jgi:hypothetical protein